MFNSKRFIIATIMGLVCGFICFGLASGDSGGLPGLVAWQLILNRTLIGFAIGISVFRMGHWSIHGSVVGILFSLPLAFGNLMAFPDYSPTKIFIMTIIMGLIYGVLIEFVTTVLLKAKMPAAVKPA